MERRIATRGIIEKDGTIFAVKHKDEHGNEVDFWAVPGGGLDPLESIDDNLTREMIEETGIAPKIGKLLFVQQYRDEKREYLEFFFHITNTEDYSAVDLTLTTHGALELSRCEFINPKTEIILPDFLQTIDLQSALTPNTPPHIFSYL